MTKVIKTKAIKKSVKKSNTTALDGIVGYATPLKPMKPMKLKTPKKKVVISANGTKVKKTVIAPIPMAEIVVNHPVAPIEIAVHDPNVFERALSWVDDKIKNL